MLYTKESVIITLKGCLRIISIGRRHGDSIRKAVCGGGYCIPQRPVSFKNSIVGYRCRVCQVQGYFNLFFQSSMEEVLQAYVFVQKIKFSKKISRYYSSHSRIFIKKRAILFLVFFIDTRPGIPLLHHSIIIY